MFFKIGHMTPAEFGFQTIMRERGVELEFIGNKTPGRGGGRSGAKGIFQLDGTTYTPDFYDPKQQTYYEVAGTRQALSQSRKKIAEVRRTYPGLSLKVVRPDGGLLEG